MDSSRPTPAPQTNLVNYVTNSKKKQHGTEVQTHLLLELYTSTIQIVTLAVCSVLVGRTGLVPTYTGTGNIHTDN